MTKEELIKKCEEASLEWTREQLVELALELVEYMAKDRQE